VFLAAQRMGAQLPGPAADGRPKRQIATPNTTRRRSERLGPGQLQRLVGQQLATRQEQN
jgi:hypothetical protein